MNVFNRTTRYILYSLIIVLINANITNSQDIGNGIQFQRPMTLVTQDQIDIVKERISNGIEPQATAFVELMQDANNSQSFTPDVPGAIHINQNGEEHLGYWLDFIRPQTMAALASALAYIYDGDTNYADKAIEIVNAWADVAPEITTVNPVHDDLLIGRLYTQFIYVADLLWDYPGWDQEDRDNVVEYLIYAGTVSTGVWRHNNIGDAALLYRLSLGCLLQDEERVENVIGWIENWFTDYSPYYSNNLLVKIRHHSEYGVDHLWRETNREADGLRYSMMSGGIIASLAERLRLLLDWDILVIEAEVSGNPTFKNALRNTLQWQMDYFTGVHSYPFYEDYNGETLLRELFEYYNNYTHGEDTDIQNWLNANRTEMSLGWFVDPYVVLNRGDVPVSDIGQNAPGIPFLISPENNASDLSLSVTFHWEDSERTDHYELQVSPSSIFSSISYANDEIESVPYDVHNLSYNTVYYWRVRAHNSDGVSRWSEVRSFTTEGASLKSEQTIILREGWNSISSYMDPHENDITKLFAGINSSIELVKNFAGETYWPLYEINDIGTWSYNEAYHVFMNEPDTLVIIGEQLLPEETPLYLTGGWNFVSYLVDQSLPVDVALENISSSLELITNNTGKIYWPEYNVATLEYMEPGQGYKIFMNEATDLYYPASADVQPRIAGNGEIQKVKSGNKQIPQQYKVKHSNIASSAILLVESSELENGDEIGVWTADGYLVGSSVVSNGRAPVTIWGKSEFSGESTGGAERYEELYLTRWSSSEEMEIPLTIKNLTALSGKIQRDNTLYYEQNSVVIASVHVQTDIPVNYSLEQNYPNPFNPITTIQYQIPRDESVTLKVYNLLGQKVKTLVDENQRAGSYEIEFSADNLASGVYYYRLIAGNYTETKRMILLQ